MGARWYDPQLARWISADTIVPQASNPQGLNRYSYVYNNALRYIDPSGHCGDDPNNPDAGCWAMIDKIQNEFTNVTIRPPRWTEEELKLLYGVLGSFLLRDAIADASITMIRVGVDPVYGARSKGDTLPLPKKDGETSRSYITTVYDSAWSADPSNMYIESEIERAPIPSSPQNFQGLIAHELTHVATTEN